MAFVTRSERKTRTTTSQTDAFVGPGTYVGHKENTMPESYAPFHSTTTRDKDAPSASEAPPPWHYNPKLPMGGHHDSGIPKKYVPFKSTELRFVGEKDDDKKPGPGAYKIRGFSDVGEPRRHQTMGAAPEEKVQPTGLSAPSIPAREQSYGYDRGKNGKLVRNNQPSEYITGRSNDCVGPNHYRVEDEFTKKRVIGGHIPVTPRAGLCKVTGTPGPGHYLEKRMSKPKRPGAAFVSKVARISDKPEADVMPGPGEYDVAKSASRNTDMLPSPAHQFFGSTVERFTDKRRAPGNPGPGSYVTGFQHKIPGNFRTSSERWRKSKKNLDDPGPGQYEATEGFGIDAEKIMNCTKSFSVLGNQGALAFGAMSTRFVKSAGQNREPGPGAYQTAEQMRMSQTQPSSFFRSKVPKDNTEAQIKTIKGAAPGEYDPRPIQDTAEVVRIQQKKEGFLTAESRFRFNNDEMEIGPGQYNPTMVNTKGAFNRSIGARGGGNVPIGFATCANRFSEGKNRKKQNPGPGDYNVGSEWVKKSYNCLFGEVL